jgi:hypothetical protein
MTRGRAYVNVAFGSPIAALQHTDLLYIRPSKRRPTSHGVHISESCLSARQRLGTKSNGFMNDANSLAVEVASPGTI